MVNLKEIYHFQGSRGCPTFSMGSNCLFPIETHIICDFPGGVRTPCPPLWIRTCRTSAMFKYFLSPETQFLQREPARLEKSRLSFIASVRENWWKMQQYSLQHPSTSLLRYSVFHKFWSKAIGKDHYMKKCFLAPKMLPYVKKAKRIQAEIQNCCSHNWVSLWHSNKSIRFLQDLWCHKICILKWIQSSSSFLVRLSFISSPES